MAVTRLADVIEPQAFTEYITGNTAEKTALFQSGVLVRNDVIQSQLQAGAESFTVPLWLDLGNEEANIANDDPTIFSTPNKISATSQKIRKAFLHNSWSAMNLASELAGSDAIARIRERVTAYWDRQVQRRLIASLKGVMADNVANDAGDMVFDISALTGTAANFSATAVIDAAGTLGDGMRDLTAIAMHSATYKSALKADLIATLPASTGGFIQTFRGMAVVVDDSLPLATSIYTSVLFGPGAVGFGMSEPRIAAGTEIENLPSAGKGGGQQVLHSRVNLGLHPLGFKWLEGVVVGQSATIAELENAANWDRVIERKSVPIAFLKHKVG